MNSVVFDVGNVLLRWDPKLPYRKHFETDAEIEVFFEAVGFHAWNLSLDAGKDWDEGVRELIADHPTLETEIQLFANNWHETVPNQIDQSVAVLKTLIHRGEAVYGITNFSANRWAECQERFPFLKTFTDVVVSAHEKLVKPDPRIYQTLLNRNDLKAENCIFIDDSEKNIQGACNLGFSTIHFSPETKLAQELEAFGITGLGVAA